MKRKLEISELIFRILSYVFLTMFALMCLYPFVYAVSASISGRHAVEYGEVIEIKEGRHPVVEAFTTDGYLPGCLRTG